MAVAKTIKATKVPAQAKQLDISDRTFMVIIFSVVMGFMGIVFFQLSGRIDQVRTELKDDITRVEGRINRLEDKMDKIDSKLDQLLLCSKR